MMGIYNIVCIANDSYVQHTAVMLTSLFTTNRNKRFAVYLLTDGISCDNKEKLRFLCTSYGCEIESITVDIRTYFTELQVDAWNVMMYLKMLIPQLLPAIVNRCLFLDVDMVINHDISPLYNINLNDSIIAGCEDMIHADQHRLDAGLQLDDYYINSGVFVADLDKWRKLEKVQPMMVFLLQNKNAIRNDQDAIALYFKGYISYLPTNKWNATNFFFRLKPMCYPKYYYELEDVRHNPYIIHYCGNIKPWFRESKHPYAHLYRKYLKQTPWRNYKFPSCKIAFWQPIWKFTIMYWLTVIGLRHDEFVEPPLWRKIL